LARIAVLASHVIPTHPAGGQMLKILHGLCTEHEFTVFGIQMHDSLSGKVEFHDMRPRFNHPRVVSYVQMLRKYERLFTRLRIHEKYDLVHSLEASTPLATLYSMHSCSAELRKLPRGSTFLRRVHQTILSRIAVRVETRLYRNPRLKRVVVVSNGLKRDIEKNYSPDVQIDVIANGIDLTRFARVRDRREPVRTELGLAESDFVGIICALGNWRGKGLDHLLSAMGLLRDKPHLKILVVGGGGIDVYEKQCDALGVSDQFVFTGFQDDASRYFEAADFFVLPTAYETFSLVMLEAAASGLPLLVTKVNGMSEDFVRHDENGLFIERDAESIAAAISQLAADPAAAMRMGAKAKEDVQAYSVERMVERYRTLYDELV